MTEQANKNLYPFEIAFDEDVDWDDLTIDIELDGTPSENSKNKIDEVLVEWVEKGMNTGYGNGIIYTWDADENEWDMEGTRLRFWVNMGSSDENVSLNELFSVLSEIDGIQRVRLGSRYYD